MLPIAFDPRKDEANQRKHGLSLADAQKLDWDGAVILPDDRVDYGEPQFAPMVYCSLDCTWPPLQDAARSCASSAFAGRTSGRRGAMDEAIKPDLDPAHYEDVDIDDEENPEWLDEDFAKARPLREVLPDLYEALVREDAEAAKRKAS
jgi:hypothetical protein